MNKLSPNQLLGIVVVLGITATVLVLLAGRQLFLLAMPFLIHPLQEFATLCSNILQETFRPEMVTIFITGGAVTWVAWALRPWLRVARLSRKISPRQEFPDKLWQSLSALALKKSRVVLATTPRPFAFCFGVLRPRIYLSTGLVNKLTQAELTAVLAHEVAHLQARDPLRSLLITLGQRLFVFLPIFRLLASRVRLTQELRADQQALQIAGRPALLSAIAKAGQSHHHQPASPMLGFNHQLNSRVNYLLTHPSTALEHQDKTEYFSLAASAFILAILGGFVFWPHPLQKQPFSHAHLDNQCHILVLGNCCQTPA